MQSKLVNDGPQKTFLLVLDKGDEAVSAIEGFTRDNGIGAAQLTGVGAFSRTVLGFFDWEMRKSRSRSRSKSSPSLGILLSVRTESQRCTHMSSSVAAAALRWAATCSRHTCARHSKSY